MFFFTTVYTKVSNHTWKHGSTINVIMYTYMVVCGSTGTGKTQTVRALAGLLGTSCVSFNCSESVDGVGLGRLLSGMIATGAWLLLDEINRLTPTMLSLVCSQVF